MTRISRLSILALAANIAVVGASTVTAARAEHPAITRAESAIKAKNVDPVRDIAPLLAALKSSRDVDEKRELVEAIADLGEADGSSPNSVTGSLRWCRQPSWRRRDPARTNRRTRSAPRRQVRGGPSRLG